MALLVVQMLTDSIGNPITRSEMQAMVTEVVELRLQEVVIVMDRLVRKMR
ncbi:hypothetical protein [Synechococcus sp. MIT S9501]